MFSKPLFKQSCKANGVMWIIITFAVCFMLVCVMVIAGNGNLSKMKVAIENTMIEEELESQTEKRAINYYEISCKGLQYFNSQFKEEYQEASQTYTSPQQIVSTAYSNAISKLNLFIETMASQMGYESGSLESQELTGIVMYVLNPMKDASSYMFDSFYQSCGETAPRFDVLNLLTYSQEETNEYISEYAFTGSAIFLAGNMVSEENIEKVLLALKEYGISREDYKQFGYEDYANVKEIAKSTLVNYRANLSYRLANLADGETEQTVKDELSTQFTQSILSTFPTEVTEALKEIGAMDMYGILIGSIFFKVAGLLLPIIYIIMVSNNLIAGQVDSGSMAYILSTPTKRRTVVFTQALFLVSSLLLMFVFTTITSIVCFSFINVDTTLTVSKLVLINISAFVVLFAMSGISFLMSSWFNRSKYSISIGGGVNMFFLVATILGLFGSKILPSVIRMDALNMFNFVSIISLFDVVSILNNSLAFLWKISILLAIGIVCYLISFFKFKKKDLPL